MIDPGQQGSREGGDAKVQRAESAPVVGGAASGFTSGSVLGGQRPRLPLTTGVVFRCSNGSRTLRRVGGKGVAVFMAPVMIPKIIAILQVELPSPRLGESGQAEVR